MKTSFFENIQQFFRNIILNASNTERTLFEYIEEGEIDKAISLMDSNETNVDNALREYYPQKHKVMSRANRYPKNKEPYITCKLPRNRQRYINEVELFFLLGNPIIWNKIEGSDEAYSLFKNFLAETRFNSKMRQVKRLAGAETESGKYYRLYKDENNKPHCDVIVVSRSLGYELRTMKDQYGNMQAIAYGYKLRNTKGKTEQHWDILTSNITYVTKRVSAGWEVSKYPNPTGKINFIYYNQPKAWEGVELRLEREEDIDSKIGDTNNYFADPIAVATTDVINSMVDPNTPAKLLQMTGANSRFEYVNPPQSSELRKAEKDNLEKSILFDTFTPDFSFENMRGMGTLSGVAIKNSLVLGYLKRANRMEIYEELVDREKNIILAVLQFLYPAQATELQSLKVGFEFAEPFGDDQNANRQNLVLLHSNGLLSTEEAVARLGIVDNPQEEVEKIAKQKQNTDK